MRYFHHFRYTALNLTFVIRSLFKIVLKIASAGRGCSRVVQWLGKLIAAPFGEKKKEKKFFQVDRCAGSPVLVLSACAQHALRSLGAYCRVSDPTFPRSAVSTT